LFNTSHIAYASMVKVAKIPHHPDIAPLKWKLPLLILTFAGFAALQMAPSSVEYNIMSITTFQDTTTSRSAFMHVKEDRQKVIVVGAGVAGLTAAKRFTKSKGRQYQVQILEASHRFGGRIQNIEDFADYPIDLGASLIHDTKWFREIAQTSVSDIQTAYLDSKYEGKHGMALFINSTWYDFLNQYLAPNPDQIVYNCPVDEIEHGSQNDSIQVSCGDQTFQADAVIVTTPLSVLKDGDITFDPPLPEKAVQKYPGEMWAGIKVTFEFQTKFYPPHFELYDQFKDMFSSEDDDYDEFPGEVEFWDYSSVHNHSTKHILAGQFIGNPALEYVNLEDEDMYKAILLRLDRKFGKYLATRNYVKHKIVNWSKEPYIRGSYSSHGSSRWRGAQKITERLYLAGEAFPGDKQEVGWVHSAALSGKDAASQLMDYWERESQLDRLDHQTKSID
jgi:monoamine oxidase